MFAASKSGSAADPTDPQFNYVTMLLHGDGTNGAQNNTFLDSSTNNFTITRNGNTTQGTFTPYGSNWSNYFDGSGDYLTATSPNLNGTWTIELWWFPLTLGTQQTFISFNNGSNSGINIFNNTSGQLVIDDGATGQSAFTTTTLTANQWNHVALVRNGTTTTGYINGVQAGSNSFTPQTTSQARIGGYNNGATPYYASGYISNVRVVNGTAVYTSAFTPSTTPLTAITNTSLLTCQSNRFIDNSTNTYTITKNGDVSVQRFSPFSPTTAYSTSVIGGSGYFDGSGDYLSMANNSAFSPGTGDFTLEGWAYHTTAAGSNNMYFAHGTGGLALYRNTSGQLELAQDAVAVIITSSATIPSNAWTHVAASRSGTTLKLFINGAQTASATNATAFSGTASEYVGISGNGSSFPMSGFISDIRLCKSALYTATFTPNTSPLTTTSQSATNCQFLTNFTNAGILDNAMMNDLETVGNAQISTSVKKYGTGSMYFDGSGDNLNIPVNENTNFGSGNFTIEGWLYLNTTGIYQVFFSRTLASSSGYGGTWIRVTDTNVLQAAFSSGTSAHDIVITCSTALSASTWYHVAYVRNGSTFTIYLNGTSNGTATTSATMSSAGNAATVGVQFNSSSAFGYLNGYIDDLRITKYARYTANFTAPTTAFADKG